MEKGYKLGKPRVEPASEGVKRILKFFLIGFFSFGMVFGLIYAGATYSCGKSGGELVNMGCWNLDRVPLYEYGGELYMEPQDLEWIPPCFCECGENLTIQ